MPAIGCARVGGLAVMLAVGSAVLIGARAGSRNQATAVDRAFQSFWRAANPGEAADRIEPILQTGISLDDALMRVRQGRDYSSSVPRGRVVGRHPIAGADHSYAFVVPENYDPSRPYQVRVHLHGGAGRARPTAINRIRTDSLPGMADEISVFPVAWADSEWWFSSQLENLSRIVDRIKRDYNVDENRVYLTGTSDGATGAYFVAFKDTTAWASFVPLIGEMTVLAGSYVRIDGDLFPGNAINKPLYVVNAGRDRLYPAHIARLYVNHLKTLGANVVFRVYPDSEHSTSWWPSERPAVEEFVRDHPREPLPDRISWETDRTDRYNRAHWLIIDRLGRVEGESRLADTNLLRRGREYDFGLRVDSRVDRGRKASQVIDGSNAAQIGLRAGDRFVEVDGAAVKTGSDISDAMQRWDLGERLRIVVERSGQRVVLDGTFQPKEIEVPPVAIFRRKRPSGRVDLVRRGNVVEASTEGVRVFTLLLSPSIFDFRRPIRVVANGSTVFDGTVEPSVATLLKWAARDNDRTMVFGAELRIDLGKE